MSTTAAPALPRLEKSSRQIRHLAQYAIVEEAGISVLSRLAVVTVTCVVVGFVAWASFMTIEEVSVSFGSVVPAQSVQVVQHLEGGIIRDVLVADRQMVEEGQALVRLDPIQATAELEQAESRLMALDVRVERLRAFVDRRVPVFKVPARHASLVTDQLDILRANEQRWRSQRAVFEEQILQKREEINAALQQQRAVQEQLRLVTEEVGMRETLFKAGHSSKVDYYNVMRQRAAVESELSRLKGQEMTARKALGELDKRIGDLDNNVRQDAMNELGAVTAEMAQIQDSLERLRDRVKRLEVVSPIRGYVQNLKAKTIGSVIPAGGVLMEVVPVDDELLVETKISTRDVGHLHPGQQAVVKVASYDFVRFGSIEGELTAISATTYVDEKENTPYYKGWIKLAKAHVGVNPDENRILPGMTVQSDIITGDKTLLEYLLKPIQRSLAQAFRER